MDAGRTRLLALALVALGCRETTRAPDDAPGVQETTDTPVESVESGAPTQTTEPEACSLDWALHIRSFSVEELTDADASPDGTVVIGGYFARDLVFGEGQPSETTLTPLNGGSDDAFLAKYEPDGTLVWAARVAHGFEYVRITALDVHSDGDIVVGGFYQDDVVFAAGLTNETTLPAADANYGNMFLARFRADGSFVWAVPIVGPAIADRVHDISIGEDGTIHAAGQYGATLTLGLGTAGEATLIGSNADLSDREIWLAAYSAEGALLWAGTAGAATAGAYLQFQHADGVAATACGPVITGTITQDPTVFSAGDPNETVLDGIIHAQAAYANDGELRWARAAGGVEGSDLAAVDGSTFLATGSSGSGDWTVFGAGSPTETSLPGYVYYLAKYTSDGDLVWAKGADSGGNGEHAASGPDALAVAGYYHEKLVFEDLATHESVPPGTSPDEIEPAAFAASYTVDGEYRCGWAHAGPGESRATAVVVDGSGGVVVGGWFRDEMTIAPDTPEAVTFTAEADSMDIFLVRYRL